jgi:hypothetical protein
MITDYRVSFEGAFTVTVAATGVVDAIRTARTLPWLQEPHKSWATRLDAAATSLCPTPDPRPDLAHPRERFATNDNPYGNDDVTCDECGCLCTEREIEPYTDGDCDDDGYFQTNNDWCAPCRALNEPGEVDDA